MNVEMERNELTVTGQRTLSQSLVPASAQPAPPEWNVAGQNRRVLDSYGAILWRRKRLIVVAALAGMLAASGIGIVQTPIYRARASLELEGVNETFLSIRDIAPTATNSAADAYFQTQVKVLQSQSVLLRVIDRLKLSRERKAAEPSGAIARFRQSAADWLHSLPVAQFKPVSADEDLLARISSSLMVRPAMQSRLIEVFFDSEDPQFARDAAEAVVQEYVSRNMDTRLDEAQKTQGWLTRQTADLEVKLEQSGQALQAYVRNSGILIPSERERESPAEERFRQVQTELSKAQAERIEKQSLYETATTTPLESLPTLLNSGPLREYQLNLADLRRQKAQMEASLTPAHYKMERLMAQITEVEKALQKEWTKTLTLIRNDYEAALRREKLLAESWAGQARVVAEQSAKSVRYSVLKHEAESSQRLYDTMLLKVKEAALASALQTTNIRVVDLPILPSAPHRPQLLVHTAVGLLTGAFLGLMLALVRTRREQALVTPSSVEWSLPVRELGVIPSGDVDVDETFLNRRDLVLLKPNERVELVTWQRKPSLLAESFRATLVSLLCSNPNGNRPKVITVTSAGNKEGKTTVTSNLGIALAEISQRVLLIDADLRAPRLSSVLDVPNSRGLSDILLGNDAIDGVPLESIVKPTAIPRLYVLPSGPPAPNISSLFHSAHLSALLGRFKKEFDTILIDAPPVLVFPDARVLGQHSDGVILVLRSHRTSLSSYYSAYDTLTQDRIPLLGAVVNDWNPRRSGIKTQDYYRNYYKEGEGG